MSLFNSILFWALVLVVGVVIVVLFRRHGASGASQRDARPPPVSSPDDDLDSSHIGGQVFEDPVLDARRKNADRDIASKGSGDS